MKGSLYPKLAFTGIIKNKKLYLPYLLTAIGFAAINYICVFLAMDSTIKEMSSTVAEIMSFGVICLAFFIAIFMFYTNSFLIKRRKTEFGLYNILGMGKRSIGRILGCETLIISAVSIVIGLTLGILLSKGAVMLMIYLLGEEQSFGMSVNGSAVAATAILFAAVFLLIFLNALRQIHVSNPIELLHSENAGEKPPKANWITAALGAVILAAGYIAALSCKDAMTAVTIFFFAVIMVIIGTQLLFVSGSVAVCKLLQQSKKYYYKTKHFISVSSMSYRMKRNGSGLASICVLCTAVLVMISSTACLFFGKEDGLRTRYPRNFEIYTEGSDKTTFNAAVTTADKILENNGTAAQNQLNYSRFDSVGALSGNRFGGGTAPDASNGWMLFSFFTLDDYNRLSGKNETLAENEAFIYSVKNPYEQNTLAIDGAGEFNLCRIDKFLDGGQDVAMMFDIHYVVVRDNAVWGSILSALGVDNTNIYSFDLPQPYEEQLKIYSQLADAFKGGEVRVSSSAAERSNFYSLYGSLFFLGILLGIVCAAATVMIMYYKQVSEGYEDKKRFEIMQQVGLTKKEISSSVNSQMLAVFFLPLIAAGVHMAFAFGIILLLLSIFGLTNVGLFALVTLISFIAFGGVYVLMYAVTSRSYYKIVAED